MREIPPIGCIVAFEAVVKHGSIARAARELSVTASAVSHRLTLLEQVLEVKLFVRGRRGVTLTSAGNRYHRALGDLLAQMLEASSSAVDRDHERSLTILGPTDYLSLWLVPRLSGFAELYPSIRIALYTPSINSFKSKTAPDLEIRSRPLDTRGLIVDALPECRYSVYGSPKVVSAQRIRSVTDLLSFSLIRTVTSCLSWETWFSHHQAGHHLGSIKPKLVSQSSVLSIQAAASGMGLALECTAFAHSFEQNGSLVKVLESLVTPSLCCYHLVHSQEVSDRPSVVRFRQWLLSQVCSQSG